MKYIVLIPAFLLWTASVFAQQYEELENHLRTSDTTVYYVHLNVVQGDFQQIAYHGGKIGVIFEDKFGTKDSVRVVVENKSERISTSYIFRKSFGNNSFLLNNVDLSGLDEPTIFDLSLVDDMGKRYKKNLMIDPIRDELPIKASIIKSPINIDCQTPTNTLIEFFSDVKGGKAPYLIEWKFPQSESDFKELIPVQGYSSGILVDLPPPYQIELKVTDSCGMIDYRTVNVACDASAPNYNSILFNMDPVRKRSIEK
ncbi:hypothetical protein J2X69_002414 [Algoriphagus sp. 4150]|uniref:hypothetical protein n=1 Tax=Algoriphagus sp. 4150 TaxID=2817756 RepID=UPI002857CDF7|nr:hypothetical protein [Algoriphagus sp. 4150]MDR7130067.1 hypothetical protein [Algoriphagus sp. 4150]